MIPGSKGHTSVEACAQEDYELETRQLYDEAILKKNGRIMNILSTEVTEARSNSVSEVKYL